MKVALVNAPSSCWPVLSIGERSFYTPLSLLCLAGALKEKTCVSVHLYDSNIYRRGWKSMERWLAELQPDILLLNGNDTMFMPVLKRLADTAKRACAKVFVLGGGIHLSMDPKGSLEYCDSLDAIALGEGEETVVETVQILADNLNSSPEEIFVMLKQVPGLCFRKNSDSTKSIFTEYRSPIQNLEALPYPAHELISPGMRSKYDFWKGKATLFHGRGCTNHCDFCVSWKHEGIRKKKVTQGNEQNDWEIKPYYRSKSPERVVEEMDWMHRHLGIWFFWWLDITFNGNPDWEENFCALLRKKSWYRKIRQFGLFRADHMLRDEKNGILEQLVDAGFHDIFCGLERTDNNSLNELDKGLSRDQITELFSRVRRRYPQVFTEVEFIVGLPDENRESIRKLVSEALSLKADGYTLSILTPFPGTELYKRAEKDGRLLTRNPEKYSLLYPVMKLDNMSSRELHSEFIRAVKRLMLRPFHMTKRIFSGHRHVTWTTINYGAYLAKICGSVIWRLITGRGGTSAYDYPSPDWYEN